MKTMKRITLLFLIILITGVCGCMSSKLDINNYKNAILSFMQEKYDMDFEVKKIYQEFNGDSGMVVRAVCSETDSEDTFSVNCYLDSTVGVDVYEIDGKEHSISEDYAAVLFQNEILSKTKCTDIKGVILKCNVDFLGRNPTYEEYKCGLLSCLQNEELNAYVKFYILSDGNDTGFELHDSVKNMLNNINPCTGYIYYLTISSFDENELNSIYAENQHDFGNYLTNSTIGESLEFTLYKKDIGLEESEKLRG